jgi:hypothetical protein
MVLVIALLVMACCLCCALTGAAVVVGSFRPWSYDWGTVSLAQEYTEQTFPVGDSPYLEIDNATGPVTVRPGESGEIHVVAIKRGWRRADLNDIRIERIVRDDGVVLRTRHLSSGGNRSVKFEIRVPIDSRLKVRTATGNVAVYGLSQGAQVDVSTGDITIVDVGGEIEAIAATGSIEVLGASAPVRLQTSTGSIRYRGTPRGECRFDVATGSISLTLPDDPNVKLDLGTSTGWIRVGYEVYGQVRTRSVQGTIGSGDEGTILARTGTGNIALGRR